jgi:hypothetical protein
MVLLVISKASTLGIPLTFVWLRFYPLEKKEGHLIGI